MPFPSCRGLRETRYGHIAYSAFTRACQAGVRLPPGCAGSAVYRRDHEWRCLLQSGGTGLRRLSARPYVHARTGRTQWRGSVCSLAHHCTLRPARSPSRHVTFYPRGFRCFVASTTAPIATGWSDRCQAGPPPAEDRRLFLTAHLHLHRTTLAFAIPCQLPDALRGFEPRYLAGDEATLPGRLSVIPCSAVPLVQGFQRGARRPYAVLRSEARRNCLGAVSSFFPPLVIGIACASYVEGTQRSIDESGSDHATGRVIGRRNLGEAVKERRRRRGRPEQPAA